MSVADTDDWTADLIRRRREKDELFARHDASPIPPHERGGFTGLSYYEPDERYRFEAELQDAPADRIEVSRTGGDTVTYVRVGRFTLELPDGTVTLAAYDTGASPNPGELFIPFRDATSGVETYGAGRYLDVRPVDGNTYLVDLNEAYHPYCAYDDSYTCPLPPTENRLDVPVRAGERLGAGDR